MDFKQRFTAFSKQKYTPIITAGIVALVIGGGIALAVSSNNSDRAVVARRGNTATSDTQGNGRNQTNTPTSDTTHTTVTPLTTNQASNSPETAAQLAYLIEEEKLAHDVYVKMYELWGAKVFSNIQRSETNHQAQLLPVMQSRNIADPRSNVVGAFTNKDLQALYDKLIAQGSQNRTEAYKVGVAIEELDIGDIKRDLATLSPADTDVRAVMESLLNGSENHLVAFNRQLR